MEKHAAPANASPSRAHRDEIVVVVRASTTEGMGVVRLGTLPVIGVAEFSIACRREIRPNHGAT